MKNFNSLDGVEVRVLPPKVVTLLSQFAYYLKRHNGTIIKLSSKNILQDVHQAHLHSNDSVLDDIYAQILSEVNSYPPAKAKYNIRFGKALKSLHLSQ